MRELCVGYGNMIAVIVIACLLVLFAMIIDLISGLSKARQRGELRSSWGLKRTLTKFITYEGGMLIAAGVDILMHMCHILELFHLDILYRTPVITCMLAIFLLIVEFISVREKADKKIRSEFQQVEELASKLVKKDDIRELIEVILNRNK